MNIGMNGVLVLHHSFSFFLSVSFSFSVFLHHFSTFSFTQSRGYPYTQRVSFLLLDTQHFTEMTAGMSVLRGPSRAVSALLMNV